MGRTVMPYRHVLESEKEWWKPFRRGISKEVQEAFDRLFDRAKMHTSAAVYMSRPWPMETTLLSICLRHGKMIEETLSPLEDKGKISSEQFMCILYGQASIDSIGVF